VTVGTTSTVSTGHGELVVLRVVGADMTGTSQTSDGAVLTATWAGSEPTVVAVLRA